MESKSAEKPILKMKNPNWRMKKSFTQFIRSVTYTDLVCTVNNLHIQT